MEKVNDNQSMSNGTPTTSTTTSEAVSDDAPKPQQTTSEPQQSDTTTTDAQENATTMTSSHPTPRRILITGSMRSGKSRYAAQLAQHFGGEQVTYVAMLAASDGDMLWRLDGHRSHHPRTWQTLERHIRPSDALQKAQHDIVIIDSLTGWVANILLEHEASGAAAARDAVTRETDHFLEALEQSPHTIIMATNEVGAGALPSNHLAMWTREALGQTNQRIAEICDTVALVIVGLPQPLKGSLPKVKPLP